MTQIQELEAKVADLEATQSILFALLLNAADSSDYLEVISADIDNNPAMPHSLKKHLSGILKLADSGKAKSAQA